MSYCQTPFTARYPRTIVLVKHCVNRLAHHRFRFKSGLKCSILITNRIRNGMTFFWPYGNNKMELTHLYDGI